MESQNSGILTSCDVSDQLLMNNSNVGKNMKNNGIEEEFFLVPEETSELQIIEREDDEVDKLSQMCRTCGTVNDHLIPIFKEDGLEHNFSSKIEKHLPMKVCETDILPLQLCYQCAATLLAFDELAESVLTVQSRLLRLQEQAEQRRPVIFQETAKAAENTQFQQKESEEEQPIQVEINENPKTERSKKKKRKKKIMDTALSFCQECDKKFSSNSALMRHIRDVHEGLKRYECEICGRPFASRLCRDEHRLTHTGERPNICEICGKTFTQKASLHVHKRFHSDKLTHWCNECGRGFKRNQELKKHQLIHSGEKPFACDLCGKCFRSRGCISRHKKTHSEQKLFSCDLCGANFAQDRYMKTHRILKHKLKKKN